MPPGPKGTMMRMPRARSCASAGPARKASARARRPARAGRRRARRRGRGRMSGRGRAIIQAIP